MQKTKNGQNSGLATRNQFNGFASLEEYAIVQMTLAYVLSHGSYGDLNDFIDTRMISQSESGIHINIDGEEYIIPCTVEQMKDSEEDWQYALLDAVCDKVELFQSKYRDEIMDFVNDKTTMATLRRK